MDDLERIMDSISRMKPAERKARMSDLKESCDCPSCPVTMEAGLKHQYYCMRGSEKQLRDKH